MRRGSLQAPRGEAHAERARLGVEPGQAAVGGLGIVANGHDDGRIAGLGRNRGAERAGEEQRIEPVRAQRGVDAVAAAEPHVLRAVALIAIAVGGEVHLVGDVELRLAVFQRALGSRGPGSTRAAR